jgi:hypothetical protein
VLEYVFQPLAASDRFVLQDPWERRIGDVRLMERVDEIARDGRRDLGADVFRARP